MAELLSTSGPLLLEFTRVPLILLAVMAAVQVVASLTNQAAADALAIEAWRPLKLWALATAPFAHGGFAHLLGNAVPFLIFGTLIARMSPPQLTGFLTQVPYAPALTTFAWVSLASGLTSGLGAFLLNRRGTRTVGASGLVFGYFGFLMTVAVRSGLVLDAVFALVLASLWGTSMLKGVLPRLGSDVSWQAHALGLIGGVGMAWLLYPLG